MGAKSPNTEELVIKRGDKIVCPYCGEGKKRWHGRTKYYGFLCKCGAIVKMDAMLGGRAKIRAKR